MGFGRSNRPASALHPCRRSSMDRAPVYEAGCSRFDPWRRRSGASPASRKAVSGASPASREACPSRRSSVGQSAALRRRRPHVRVVPARPSPCSSTVEHAPGPAVVAQRTERPPPKRQGARSSRADGTKPRRRGGTATRLAFTQEIAGPTPAGGTSPTQPGGAHRTPGPRSWGPCGVAELAQRPVVTG